MTKAPMPADPVVALLPCPFCGGKPERFTSAIGVGFENRQVQCRSCGASAFDLKWNTRTPTPASGDVLAEVERLRGVLVRICEEDRYTRKVKATPEGGLRGRGGMIAAYALTGENGSFLTDEAIRLHVARPASPTPDSSAVSGSAEGLREAFLAGWKARGDYGTDRDDYVELIDFALGDYLAARAALTEGRQS